MRTEILVLLSILTLGPPLFVSRAQLRQPLDPQELSVLMAAQSLAGDLDLVFDAADQVRLSRHRLENVATPPPGVPLELRQPIYSVLTGPLALAFGDGGLVLANVAAFLALLWSCCRPRQPDGPEFWWALSYFVICAYPVHVWRLDESVLLGAGLYLVLGPWGKGRSLVSGVLAGALLPGHLWLLPAAAALCWLRDGRFRKALVLGAALAFLVIPATPDMAAPDGSARAQLGLAPAALLATAAEPEPHWQTEALSMPPWLAMSWPSRFLFGRLQGVVPYFLPWLVGLGLFFGYERNAERRLLATSLLACLALGGMSGSSQPALVALLPAFFLFSGPVERLSTLVALWCASSLFCAVLFMNPIHAASHPGDALTLWPHRLLPLEIGSLDPRSMPGFRASEGSLEVLLPGRDAWPGADGQVIVRGKRWGHVVLRGAKDAGPRALLLRSPVDVQVELRAGGATARLELRAGQPARFDLPADAWVPAGAGLWGQELLLRASAGLVPRLELDAGDGVDYVGLEVWPLRR